MIQLDDIILGTNGDLVIISEKKILSLDVKFKKIIHKHVFLSVNNNPYVIKKINKDNIFITKYDIVVKKIIKKNKLLAIDNNIYHINVNNKIDINNFTQIASDQYNIYYNIDYGKIICDANKFNTFDRLEIVKNSCGEHIILFIDNTNGLKYVSKHCERLIETDCDDFRISQVHDALYVLIISWHRTIITRYKIHTLSDIIEQVYHTENTKCANILYNFYTKKEQNIYMLSDNFIINYNNKFSSLLTNKLSIINTPIFFTDEKIKSIFRIADDNSNILVFIGINKYYIYIDDISYILYNTNVKNIIYCGPNLYVINMSNNLLSVDNKFVIDNISVDLQ